MTTVCVKRRKIVGLYFSDTGNVYGNSATHLAKNNSYITDELGGYVPILDYISLNTRDEVKFADGLDKNKEVTSYNRNASTQKLSPEIVKRSRLDVTVNDLFLGPVRLVLNFTKFNITINTVGEFRKTYVPLQSSKFEMFDGRLILLDIHSLNSPKNIQGINGICNYLETLTDKFKHNKNLEQTVDIFKYVTDKWSSLKLIDHFSNSNSIKVVTSAEITESELEHSDGKTLHITNEDIYVSLEDIVNIPDHHSSSSSKLSNSEAHSVLRTNSFTCYIVDNENTISDRFVNIAGAVVKVKKIIKPNQPNGLYIMSTCEDGKAKNEKHFSLDEIDSNPYVYKSYEEANKGADLRSQYKDSLEFSLQELESIKLEKNKELLEMKAKYEEYINKQSLDRKIQEAEIDKLREEIKLKLDNTKAEHEKELLAIKRKYDDYKYELDHKSHTNKVHYEESKYQKDSVTDTLKTIAAVAGVVATGYVIYSKLK